MRERLRRLFEEEAKASRKLEKASRAGRRELFVKACEAWELAKARVEADPDAMRVLSETTAVFGVRDGFLHLDDAAFRAELTRRITETEGGE